MGLAYLPDGRRMPYEVYLRSPEWKNKKANRLAFDNWQCGICHREITDIHYETHHLNYDRLGDEDVAHDIITLCHDCHMLFHSIWEKSNNGESAPLLHWKANSLKDTAKLCIQYLSADFIFNPAGEYNLCQLDTIGDFIDKYFVSNEITEPVRICEDDVRLFIRNKRYDVYLDAMKAKDFDLETWLDGRYGPKGIPGGNKRRAEARRFFTKHKPAAMKRIYKENDNVNILMEEVRKMQKGGLENE